MVAESAREPLRTRWRRVRNRQFDVWVRRDHFRHNINPWRWSVEHRSLWAGGVMAEGRTFTRAGAWVRAYKALWFGRLPWVP